MSHVTNAMVSFSVMEPSPDAVREALSGFGADGHQGFGPVIGHDAAGDGVVGGSKYLETNVMIAAFNYVPTSELKKAFAKHGWFMPGNAQLFIQEQDDNKFTVYTAAELRAAEAA